MSIKQARLIVNAHKHNLLNSFCNNGYFNKTSEFLLALLFAAQNEHALKNLALLVHKAFSRRKILLSWRTWKRWDMEEEDEQIGKTVIITILLYIRFPSVCNIPTSATWLLCVHCIIRLIVLAPLQMGLCGLIEENVCFRILSVYVCRGRGAECFGHLTEGQPLIVWTLSRWKLNLWFCGVPAWSHDTVSTVRRLNVASHL